MVTAIIRITGTIRLPIIITRTMATATALPITHTGVTHTTATRIIITAITTIITVVGMVDIAARLIIALGHRFLAAHALAVTSLGVSPVVAGWGTGEWG